MYVDVGGMGFGLLPDDHWMSQCQFNKEQLRQFELFCAVRGGRCKHNRPVEMNNCQETKVETQESLS